MSKKAKPQKPQKPNRAARQKLQEQRLAAVTTAVTVIANARGQVVNLVQVGEPINLLEMAALLRAGGDQAVAAHVREEEKRKASEATRQAQTGTISADMSAQKQ